MSLLIRSITKWSLFLACWSICLSSQAQKKHKEKEKPAAPAQTFRAELKSDSYEEDHLVQPLPDSTLLVITTKRSTWFSKEDFVLTKFSKRLEQVWSTKHEQLNGTSLEYVTADQQNIYLLFSTRELKKLMLYKVDPATGAAFYSEHKLPTAYIDLRDMKALDGQFFLYGLEHMKLNMLHLNPAEEEIRLLPAVFGTEDDLGEFRVDTLTKTVEFVVGETNGWRSRVQTKRMTSLGEVVGTYFLQPRDIDNNLQPARLTPGDTLSKLLIGTFGYRTTIFSKGLFTGDLAGNLKYYEFSQLKHFFEYTTPGRQKRLREKFAKREAKGKPMILRYRLLLHPLMPHPQGYALVGEIYYPQYNNNGYTSPGPSDFGNGPFTRRVSEGFRFSHAIACVFDRQGNLIWDNAFKLQNKTYPVLAPTIEAGVMPNGHIAMVYPEDEFLRFKTLQPNVSLSNEEKVEVRLQEETDKKVTSNNEGIVHWYGGNFVAFGFQRIRPAAGDARTVFYLQNVVFE
ncbi:hypothetical protein [Rufibacter quisquiliarum]|uniref:Uncharacterized protein n=1 Tax=Rufibacter quisquiliarum TaxID=1549639 RepID=A0A839GB97_9BACT|nr:hypothetical protein [Rufibacter quisquiliarum]MBA9076814.1 hypothetical protein [Rufibacter quisquiliarum]